MFDDFPRRKSNHEGFLGQVEKEELAALCFCQKGQIQVHSVKKGPGDCRSGGLELIQEFLIFGGVFGELRDLEGKQVREGVFILDSVFSEEFVAVQVFGFEEEFAHSKSLRIVVQTVEQLLGVLLTEDFQGVLDPLKLENGLMELILHLYSSRVHEDEQALHQVSPHFGVSEFDGVHELNVLRSFFLVVL